MENPELDKVYNLHGGLKMKLLKLTFVPDAPEPWNSWYDVEVTYPPNDVLPVGHSTNTLMTKLTARSVQGISLEADAS